MESKSSTSEDSWKSSMKCKESDSDSNTFEDDQPSDKIKPEVELKEEAGGLIYKTDTQGNLKLVCSSMTIQNVNSEVCDTTPLNDIHPPSQFDDCSEQLKDDYIQAKLIAAQNDIIKNQEAIDISIDTSEDVTRYSNSFSPCPPNILTYQSQESFQLPTNNYPDFNQQWTHLKGLPDGLNNFFKKQFDDRANESAQIACETSQETDSSLGVLSCASLSDSSTLDSCSKSKVATSSTDVFSDCKDYEKKQLNCPQISTNDSDVDKTKDICCKTSTVSEAEKKRLYRQRIKETNPELWQAIKQRDAAQKRKKRAHRQMIAREMQMQLELESSNLGDVHGMYLDALKKRYPDLWEQLLQTVPEVRNRIDHKSRGAKSVAAYKDIIAAEKKRLYREKVKREKPEMWERQKARDAQRRSIQRLMNNPKRMYAAGLKSELSDSTLLLDEKKLTYLQNLEVEQNDFISDQNLTCSLTPLQPVSISDSISDSNYSEIHDDTPASSNESVSTSTCDDLDYKKTYIKLEDNPSSTQSKMLWFWNDTPDFSKNRSYIPESESKNLETKSCSDDQIDCLTKESCKKKKRVKIEKE